MRNHSAAGSTSQKNILLILIMLIVWGTILLPQLLRLAYINNSNWTCNNSSHRNHFWKSARLGSEYFCFKPHTFFNCLLACFYLEKYTYIYFYFPRLFNHINLEIYFVSDEKHNWKKYETIEKGIFLMRKKSCRAHNWTK